jgi:collagenase-like PrtC family protease
MPARSAKQHLSVGAFVNHLDTADDLIARPRELKHRFTVTSVYGTFPNVIFNGGRTLFHFESNITDRKEWFKEHDRLWYEPDGMQELIRRYNRRGIAVRYTYSNPLITKKHLADAFANLTLEIAHDPMNAVITSNPVIERYVRTHYPKYQIVGSVTAAENLGKNLSVAHLKRRAEEVDLLVLPPEYNDRRAIIEKLPIEKLEVILNERCVPHCPNRRRHYRAIGKSQLLLDPSFQAENHEKHCPLWLAELAGQTVRNMVLTDDQIDALQDIGVRHFKFVGREMARDWFAREADTVLVKEKYSRFQV